MLVWVWVTMHIFWPIDCSNTNTHMPPFWIQFLTLNSFCEFRFVLLNCNQAAYFHTFSMLVVIVVGSSIGNDICQRQKYMPNTKHSQLYRSRFSFFIHFLILHTHHFNGVLIALSLIHLRCWGRRRTSLGLMVFTYIYAIICNSWQLLIKALFFWLFHNTVGC